MRAHAAITAVAAAAVIGGGVAFGSARQQDPPPPSVRLAPVDVPTATQLPPGVRPAPVDAPTPKQLCEQAEEQFRQEHPEGYSGGCNSGSGTLTIP